MANPARSERPQYPEGSSPAASMRARTKSETASPNRRAPVRGQIIICTELIGLEIVPSHKSIRVVQRPGV